MFTFAHSVTVDDDEGRFTLEVETDEMIHRFIIHDIDLDAFYDQVRGRIGPYLREMHETRDAVARGVTLEQFTGFADRYLRAEDYPDGPEGCPPAEDAYDPTDPKHPRYHSVHVDLWDSREGK
jgi:hypothetical protein